MATLSGCQPSASPSNTRPNIILVMADDLGWGDVGFNGARRVQTPNLDALAERGIVFERFYAASAVCSPTRASVLTGRHPYRLGIPTANAGHLREGEITLAELLRDAGYATGHFGKWHLGTLTTTIRDSNRGRPGHSAHFSVPTQHGFDVYFSTEAKVPTHDPMLEPVEFDTLKGESLRFGWASVARGQETTAYGTHYWEGPNTPSTVNLDGDDSRVIMDRVLNFIDRVHQNAQPFLAVVWLHSPHIPVVASEAHRAAYAGFSHEEQLYFGAISALDEQIGRLWSYLEDLEVEDGTMLWFASDNGPERRTPGSAGPFRERKRSLYEGGVRVPAFVVWPAGIEAGERITTPAVTSDYVPTILDALDLDYPDDRPLDGVSLMEIIAGLRTERGRPIGFQIHDKLSWVDDTYKLISVDQGRSFELYNLVNDPEERNDLRASQPERAASMKAALLDWVASCAESERRFAED